MENNNQKIIIFKEGKDPDDVITEILESNGLKETLDDYFDKIDKEEQEPWLDILYKLAKNLADETITDINFIIDVQKQLNVSEQVAKNILKEVKEKFLPLTEILSEDEIKQESDQEFNSGVEVSVKPIKKPIGVAEILSPIKSINEVIPPNFTTPAPKTLRETKKLTIDKKIGKEIKKVSSKSQSDSYRESI